MNRIAEGAHALVVASALFAIAAERLLRLIHELHYKA